MTTKQNLHTHCTFCDGKNTMQEMLQGAINSSLTSLGFSSHIYTGLKEDVAGMKKEDVDLYFQTIEELKKTSPIKIYTGLELESQTAQSDIVLKDKRCDYAIGSVHFYIKDNKRYFVDWDLKHYLEAVEAFNGPKALMENYYSEIVRFANVSDYDITGHFDLFTKFIEVTDQSFVEEKWYKDLAINALETVASKDKIFEINTGAISRGFKHTVYPQNFLIKRMKEINAKVIISADSHQKDTLTCHFEETEELLKSFGFKTQMMLTDSGFVETAL